MGAVPKGLNYILSSLKLCPENTSWIHLRKVCLLRSEEGSIGIKIETFDTANSSKSTCTVVTKIKPECVYLYGQLVLLDRILKINDRDICHLKDYEVAQVLRHLSGKKVELTVISFDCSNGIHKRAFDRLSTSSDHSLEMRKVVEKSRNKRMAKSNSVESEDEPLLNASSGQLSPDTPPMVDSGSGCMRDGSNQMFHSLPDNFNAAIQFPRQDDELRMSLPLETLTSERKYVIDNSTQHKDSFEKEAKRPNSVIAVNSVVLSPDQKLTYPQMLKWEMPKAVDISRGSKGCFGFTYKVKTCKLQTEEIYTMVNHIAKDGPACGKLMVADWIRSVNGQPLQNAEQAKKIPDMLAQETTIHIVIQRPEGLLVSPKAMNTPRDRLTIPRIDRPITSPAQRAVVLENKQKRGLDTKPSGITRKVNVVPEKTTAEPVQGYQKDSQLFNVFHVGVDLNDSGSFVETQDSCSITGVDMILPDDIMSMRNMQMNRTINLSKVRIFLCGSDARTFAKLLFPTYAPQFTGEANNSKLYHCVKCMMGMDKSGAISFRPWSSLDRLLNDGEVTNLHASSDSLATGDVSKDRCSEDDSFIHQGSVNVEFFIVPDEKFFHHCCQYLFTRTSIFVLTFDGAKVLKSANAEILHLENIIHTIRCFDGYECPILTYGLLSNDNSDLNSSAIDEVRTLFYLPYGQQIQKYNVPMPDLFCPFLTNMESHDVTRQIQRKMWKVIVDTVQKQHVIVPTVSIISHLDEARQDGKQSITDSCFTEMFKKCVPGDYPDIQQIVWTDLKNFGETLSSKAAPMTMSHLQYLDKLLFIDTEILLTSIQNIILYACKIIPSSEGIKQKWLKVLSTGIVSQEDLVNVISYQGGNGDNIVLLLEIFGLIYRHNVNADMGIHYFIPYFMIEQSPSDITHQSELSVYLLFRAHVHVSSMLFYQLAFGLNADSDTKYINVQGSSHCSLHHMGYEISLYHQKLLDRVQVTFTRTEKILCKPSSIFQWLSKQCRAILGNEIKYVLGPACPLQQCSFIKQYPTEVHVLDMSRSQVFCGDTRVDHHRSIKIWIQDTPIPKPVQSVKRGVSDSGSCESMKSEKLQCYVNDLPYSVLHRISMLLLIDTKNNDWKTLGGLLGLTTEDVNSYATQKDASLQLLIDFGRKQVLTVSRLMELLADKDLERLDVKQVLQDWLNG